MTCLYSHGSSNRAFGRDTAEYWQHLSRNSPSAVRSNTELKVPPSRMNFSLTNGVLRIETALVDIDGANSDSKALVFNLGFSFNDGWPLYTSRGWIGIYLVQTQDGFVRAKPTELFEAQKHPRKRRPPGLIYIRTMVPFEECDEIARRFERAVKVVCPDSITIDSVAPKSL